MQNADDRLIEAKARDIGEIADQLGILGLSPWPPRHNMESTGPCPKCGGHDRFSINSRKGVFNCRRCDGNGDVINLVRFVQDCTLPEALEWLCGPATEIPEAERKARAKASAENRARNEARASRAREEEIRAARAVWRSAKDYDPAPVSEYLALRGISTAMLPRLPACLRYHPRLPYMAPADRQWREVHRGPAMLAIVQRPDGNGMGCHRTWFDVSAPNGAARIIDPTTGEVMVRKKMRGSKRGGSIRLHTPDCAWDTLVMGEGIETTLTGMVVANHLGLYPGAAWWAGVDLGNISGRRQTGKGLKFAGLPDMSDADAFVPPPWVRRWILIEDGDSDPRDTRAKLQAGARRAMLKIPGLIAQIIPCPKGQDLNDVLMGAEDV